MNTKIIKLDINRRLYDKIVAKQDDTGSRFLLFQLLDGAVPFNLTDRSVRVYGVKPDGAVIFNDLTVTHSTTGFCLLELTNQMLAIAGTVKLELMITEGDKKLTSIPFEMEVIKKINSNAAVESSNEFRALLNALKEIDEWNKEFADKSGKLEELYTPRLNELGSQLETMEQQSNIIKFPVESRVYLHRGAMQLAPENTIASLIEAVKSSIPYCEIDIRCTSDNVLILHHDSTLDRMTNGTGAVNSKTLAEIKALNIDTGNNIELYNSEKVPTLEEVLNFARREDIKLMLHLYDLGSYSTTNVVVKNFYDLLEKTKMTNNVICSGSNIYWYWYELRKLNKNIPISYVTTNFNINDFDKVKELFPCYYGIIGNPTKEQVELCHINGIPVVCDNITTTQHYQNMIINGVDIMLTDIMVGGDI